MRLLLLDEMKKNSIDDFGDKLDMLLSLKRDGIIEDSDILIKLDITKDYLYRLRKGFRTPTSKFLKLLSDLFKIDMRDWELSILDFGACIGIQRDQISSFSNTLISGIDFLSRIKDGSQLRSIHSIIKGYWESYYYSVSKVKEKLIRKDICYIGELRDDGLIDCKVYDHDTVYIGHCFPIKNHLYFILEKEIISNEIIVYCTNHPDRIPPKLYGVMLCLSGGVDTLYTFPAAAKVGFQYIGDEDQFRKKYDIPKGTEMTSYIREKATAWLSDKPKDKQMAEIFSMISNEVKPDEIPSALISK